MNAIKSLLLLLTLLCVATADVIKKESQVIVTIKGVPAQDAQEISSEYGVYANGTINLPYIDPVYAAGKTPSQLAKHIEQLYTSKKIYTNPTVNVRYQPGEAADVKMITFVSNSGSKNVPYMRGFTLQTAIAAAGGAQTFDSKRHAILERNGKTYKYDMEDASHRNLKIYPNDVIRLPHVNEGGILDRLFNR